MSRFKVVSTRIPKYLKVCTHSITSPLNTNSWHGSAELNIMTFVFFTFNVSPRLAQNYWSTSNCYCSPTSDSDIKARSSTKSNNHTCTSTRASASHSLPSKRLFRASKCSPNNRGAKKATLLHTLLAFEAKGDTFAWVVDAYGILGIHRLQASQEASLSPRPANTCHNTSRNTVSNTFLKSTKQQ